MVQVNARVPYHTARMSALPPLGPVELLLPLGRGGVADVYLARLHGDPIGAEFIVKRLRAELRDDSALREALRREGALGSELDHEALPRTLHVDDIDDWTFLAMPYVWGDDLRELAKRDRSRLLTPARAAWIVAHAARALALLHDRGLVHRDVSPPNLVVGFDGRVVLIDLGIANAGAPAGARTPEGKFAYMSPEQARGDALDGRSDLFSLALILYELIARTRAMRGAKSSEAAIEIARSLPRLGALALDVPSDLTDVVDDTLSFDPAGRPPDARAFADALQRVPDVAAIDAREIGDAARSLGAERISALEHALGPGYAGPTQAPAPHELAVRCSTARLAPSSHPARMTDDNRSEADAEDGALDGLDSPRRDGRGILLVFGAIGTLLFAFIGYKIATDGLGTQFHADYDAGPSLAEFDAEPIPTPDPPPTVATEVVTTPPGAWIVVNGVAARAQTPATVDLVEGRDNSLSFHLVGHETHWAEVSGDGDPHRAALTPLPERAPPADEHAADQGSADEAEGSATPSPVEPGQALLRIVARDVGGDALDAEVLVNGERALGNTPLDVPVDAGVLHHITVRRGGFRDSATYVRAIEYRDERSVREVILEMSASPSGERARSTIRVRPVPQDATVALDGEDQGRRNVIPVDAPGLYTVTITAPDHEPHVQHVDARLGQFEMRQTLTPVRTGPTRLTLEIEPSETTVFAERLRHGSAGARQLRAPISDLDIEAGTYRLTFEHRTTDARWRGRTELELEPATHHTLRFTLSADGLEAGEFEAEPLEE